MIKISNKTYPFLKKKLLTYVNNTLFMLEILEMKSPKK